MEKKKDYVYVFTAEQAWDFDVADTIVKVFATMKAATDYLHNFLHEGEGSGESLLQYVKNEGWVTEYNRKTLYRAFLDGSYATDHVELTITKCEIQK